MREHRPSTTAAFVAACRGLASLLPPEARLSHDPYGAHFAGSAVVGAARMLDTVPALAAPARVLLWPLVPWVAYMQLRTRALDEQLFRYLDSGGRQIVLLGAGFDCRAARFTERLAGATVIEVDHPATQARKREVLARAGASSTARYLAWDFEREDLSGLPARLRGIGHAPEQPTLTLWEGVTMYLSEPAIEATVRAVAAYSAPGSLLCMSYVERRYLERPSLLARALLLTVRGAGEPFRFGWNREELPGWLSSRSFALRSDQGFDEVAAEWMPPRYAALARATRRLAVAERTPPARTAPA